MSEVPFQEYIAVAELLRRGHDIYMTLVDDQQIDCVLRKEYKGKPIYLDIQIKARSKDCNPKNAGTFAALEIRKPRKNFFHILFGASRYLLGYAFTSTDKRGESGEIGEK